MNDSWVGVAVIPDAAADRVKLTLTVMFAPPPEMVIVSVYGVAEGVNAAELTDTDKLAGEDELTVPLVGVTLSQVAVEPWLTVKLVAVELVLVI